MNWWPIAILILTLTAHFHFGIATNAETFNPTKSVKAQVTKMGRSSPQNGISFTINTGEVVLAEYISAGLLERTEQKLNGATAGIFLLPVEISSSNPTMSVRLISDNGNILAEDIIIFSVKENLVFDAASSVRVSILRTAILLGMQTEQLAGLYSRIDDHPRFHDLVALYKAEKRIPVNKAREDEAANLAVDITFDLLGIRLQDH